jgi:hypothetical protein
MIATHEGEPLTLSDDARRRHLHVVGQTGTGKTTLIKNLVAQDLVAGRGVALIDPLGHLAQAVLALVPPHRAHELVYFDPADLDMPIAFNVLERAHPDRHAVIADDIVSAFVHIWGPTAVGDRSQQVLRNSIRALMAAPSATLLCIPRLLTDEAYRARIVRSISDPVVLMYWTQQFANYDDNFRQQVIAPILNKLDAVLSAPELRNIIGQPKSTLNLRRTMDEGRILIVNLSKGRLGESNAHILGALIVTKLAQAAFAREDTPQPERKPFYLYADEFQDYASAGFLRILSQARNYALSILLGHQYLGQLSDDLREAVLGNAASTIAFRVGAEDAPILAEHIGLEPQIDYSGMGSHETSPATLLTKLANFHAYARTLVDEAPTDALPLEMLPDPPPANHRPHRLISYSRMRFGRDRATIDGKIARFLKS